MATVFKFDNGTELNLNSEAANVGYLLGANWSPNVAAREGLRTLERVQVLVKGSTATNTAAKIDSIKQYLTQAGRWARGEAVSAVTCHYAPEGTALGTPAEAVVYGGQVITPPNYERMLVEKKVLVTVEFTRGDWLGAETTASTAGSTSQPGIMSKNFTIGEINSPYDLNITLTDSTATYNVNFDFGDYNYLIYSTEADRIAKIEAEDLADASKWTSVTDVGNAPSGGNILRYIATDTTWQTSAAKLFSAVTFDTSIRMIGIYGIFRCTGQNHVVRAAVSRNQFDGDRLETRPILVDTTNYANPRPVYLGQLAIPPSGTFFDIVLEAKAAAATGSPKLDCDVLVLVDAQNQDVSGALAFGDAEVSTGYSGSAPASFNLHVKGYPLSELVPEVYENAVSTDFPLIHTGNARLRTRETTSAGAGVACLLLTQGPAANPAKWRMYIDTSLNGLDGSFTATYRRCYMVVP